MLFKTTVIVSDKSLRNRNTGSELYFVVLLPYVIGFSISKFFQERIDILRMVTSEYDYFFIVFLKTIKARHKIEEFVELTTL